jgi:hypothetical protein
MEKNKSCVLFSSWVPAVNLDIGKYYIDTIFNNLKDFDLFVGVNPKSCDEWVSYLEQSHISFHVSTSPTVIDSDVTGFMAALELYKKSKNTYLDVWFTHSKGTSYPSLKFSEGYRKYLEYNFWCKQNEVREHISQNGVGLLSTDIIEHNNPSIDNILNGMYDFKINNIGFYVPNTFYVTDTSFNDFIQAEKFNIEEIDKQEDKRYFFEAYFCAVPMKMGKKFKSIGV